MIMHQTDSNMYQDVRFDWSALLERFLLKTQVFSLSSLQNLQIFAWEEFCSIDLQGSETLDFYDDHKSFSRGASNQ